MTRPNRYPYTKNQWEEETTLVCFGDDTSLKLRVERNRMTGRQNNDPTKLYILTIRTGLALRFDLGQCDCV